MSEAERNGWRLAYPAELEAAELRRLAAFPQRSLDHRVGVALSGGGIRSATFCLGVFQALARLKLLSRIHYLSTVSGGGYFGACLGRLFTRDQVRSVDDVEWVLTRPDGARADGRPDLRLFAWLRENGRYLSPRGAGDLLLGGAVLLRNWVAVHAVLTTLLVLAFLTLQLVRIAVEVGLGQERWSSLNGMLVRVPGAPELIWWSPYTGLALVLFVLWAVPPGWAYWLLVTRAGTRPTASDIHPVWGVVAVLVFAAVSIGTVSNAGRWVAAAVLVVATLTLAWWIVAEALAARAAQREVLAAGEDPEIFANAQGRNWLALRLKDALVWTGVAAAVAILDSLGQTVFVLATTHRLTGWIAAIVGALATVAAFARQIAVLFGKPGDRRPRLWLAIAAPVAAGLVTLVALTVVSVASHAVAWNFTLPDPSGEDFTEAYRWRRTGWTSLGAPLYGWLVALALSALFGRARPFLNHSSHHPLYSARLTRAYLGASNPRRVGDRDTAVTSVIPGDDIGMPDYWPRSETESERLYAKGTPLHLVNVTVNETIVGKSQVQQQDRKGTGMALGPAGLSVGVRHHVVFEQQASSQNAPRGRSDLQSLAPQAGYRVFEYAEGRFTGEQLSLGQWVGISGASFSTGMGARTNLGMSLLTGFGNVRLGYWWDSGVEPGARRGSVVGPSRRRLHRVFRALFPVQSHLVDEFLARFPGTAHRWWYLSDGGHFENLGAYELVRRRLPTIVLVDAEADTEYTFEGLANLVRKARLDFNAEIRFLTKEDLDTTVADNVRAYFGTLDELRRGRWVEEPVRDPNVQAGERRSLDPVDSSRLSLAHAALARVHYDGSATPGSWLLYLKPTLTGDEPADVRQYHSEHPAFPQETTADQFFDEAQWESYRRLGEHIAGCVFRFGAARDGGVLAFLRDPIRAAAS